MMRYIVFTRMSRNEEWRLIADHVTYETAMTHWDQATHDCLQVKIVNMTTGRLANPAAVNLG